MERSYGSRRTALAALAGFTLLSCVWSWSLLISPLHRATKGATGDGTLIGWFLTWVPWAVLHAHNPLVSGYLDAPRGVSTMWNTGLTLLGLLLAPLTLTLGPVASLNVITIAAPAASAFTAFLLLRRHAHGLGATAGALLFGFGPAVAAQNIGHYNLSFLALPPLIVMAIEDLIGPAGYRTRRVGVRLGVLLIAQLLIGEEILLITAAAVAVLVGFWLVVGALRSRTEVLGAGRRLLVGGGTAVAVFVVLAAFPLFEQFHGRYVLHSPIQSTDSYAARAAQLVVATPLLWLHGFYPGSTNLSEIDGYLGWGVLAVVVIGAALTRRRWAFLVVLATLIVLEVFSFGPYRQIGKPASGRLPWDLVAHRGLFANLLTVRFGIIAALAAAFLLALSLDAVRARLPGRRGTALAAVLAVAALAPLFPHGWPTAVAPDRPDCMQGGLVESIRSSHPTLLLPYPNVLDTRAQLWQAEAHFPFPIVGGYAVHPDRAEPYLDGTRGPVRDLFLSLVVAPDSAPRDALGPGVLADLRGNDVRQIVVLPTRSAVSDGRFQRYLRKVLALAPRRVGQCTVYRLS